MTAWNDVLAADCAVPTDRPLPELVAELEIMLADPDPQVRDRLAYDILGAWVAEGVLDAELVALGDRMAAMLRHADIQARTFAVLILGEAVDRDLAAQPDVARWQAAFAQWWTGEEDLTGFHERLGWLHAGAHGADLVAALGRRGAVTGGGLGELLSLTVDRLLAPTDFLFAQAEDDRIAHALFTVLSRPQLDAATAVGWLDRVEQALRAAKGGPMPVYAANTVHTMRALYPLVDRGARLDRDGEPVAVPHRDAVLSRLADVLTVAWPLLAPSAA